MIHTKAAQAAREARATNPTMAEVLAKANRQSLDLADVRSSERLPSLVASITSTRDFHRDLGTHGIGAMQGRPWDDQQRASHREMERVCTLLIGVLA